MSGADDEERFETDEGVQFRWIDPSVDEEEPVLHLVIACLPEEPGRVGQSARLDQEGFIGRPLDASGRELPIAFVEQRPGENVAKAHLTAKRISRRQLTIVPQGADRVLVRNTGKRDLFWNGQLVTECIVQAGDTLMLEHEAVFAVDARPVVLPPCDHYPSGGFAFGEPDLHGMVGESEAAWDLREQLAAAAATDAHVLILGETGAGKEVAAGALHGLSRRRDGALLERNAATIPEPLLDAELFGNAKNYPNPGMGEREGLIGATHGGHLMLDEIGEERVRIFV